MSIRWVVPYAGVPPESLFGATGGLGAPLVLDTTTLTLYTYISGVGVTAVGGGGGGGGITWTTTTVDFGATPVAEAEFTVVDAACTAAKNVLIQISGTDSTADNDAPAHALAATFFAFSTTAGTGDFTLSIHLLFGLISGQIKIRYALT